MLDTINNQGNAKQNHEIPPHTSQNGHHLKDKKQLLLARMWRKGDPPTLLVGM